jgi:uncharacterized membrane protein
MAKVVLSIFSNSDKAGEAVAELKNQKITDDVSVLARDETPGTKSTDVKQNLNDTAAVGAGVGAVAGAIWAGLGAVAIPGLGLIVGGPLAALISGALAGAATGGIVGLLVDLGIPDDVARDYETRLKRGEVAVGVDAADDKLAQVEEIITRHGGEQVQIVDKKDRASL